MKGDFSRQTFTPEKHYSGVRMQQGRVQLDADGNEQADIVRHRAETAALDLIGGCGGPIENAAFGVVTTLAGFDAAEKTWLDRRFPPAFTLAPGDLLLSPGRYYVNGVLCENEHFVPLARQPDLPGGGPLDATRPGFYLLYLDVWDRHLTILDDPALREIALGGPDTTTRTRTIWQVRSVFSTDPINCLSTLTAFDAATVRGTGTLRARALPPAPDDEPCIVPPGAGFRGLENQLYRVEIHDGGAAFDLTAGAGGGTAITILPPGTGGAIQVRYTGGTWNVGDTVEVFQGAAGVDPLAGTVALVVAKNAARRTLTLNVARPEFAGGDQPRLRLLRGAATKTATFKWSRDNGIVVGAITRMAGREVTIDSLGPDDVLNFAPGQWVEISDDASELNNLPGTLAQIEAVGSSPIGGAPVLTLRGTAVPLLAPALPDGVDPARHPKLRRWDGVGAVKARPPAGNDGFLSLEDGVQVRFADGATYKTGNYWLIPARTANGVTGAGDVLWPKGVDNQPEARAPEGIRHHYCRLAIIESDGAGALTLRGDCRDLFPPVTALTHLAYVGGDGQEALPGTALPRPLEAGVFNGRFPVTGARVRLSASDNGRLAADPASAASSALSVFEAATDADGVARAGWLLAVEPAPASQQVEAVLLDSAGNPIAAQVLHFGGRLSIAREVAYDPADCPNLANARTVQAAIDILCRTRGDDEGVHVTNLFTLADRAPLRHNEELRVDLFARGIAVETDAPLDPAAVSTAACFVTLELPYPISQSDRNLWDFNTTFAFQPLVLDGEARANGALLLWRPARATRAWLTGRLFPILERLNAGPSRLLARLTVKGNFLWQEGDPDRFLDGDAFGAPPNTTPTNLRLPQSGDGRKGGDFEAWFFLVPPDDQPLPAGPRVAGARILSIPRTPRNAGEQIVGTVQSAQEITFVKFSENPNAIEVTFAGAAIAPDTLTPQTFLVQRLDPATGGLDPNPLPATAELLPNAFGSPTARWITRGRAPLRPGEYRVTLKGDGDLAVRAAASAAGSLPGPRLDGEPNPSFPSGDGAEGSDFFFRLVVN